MKQAAGLLAALALAACVSGQAEVPQTETPAQPARSVQYSLEILDIQSGVRRVVLTRRDEIGAPNWSRDGRELYFNSDRKFFAVGVEGGRARLIHTVSGANGAHDHGPSPDGALIAVSNYSPENVAFIDLIPAGGGAPRRLTANGPSYFHGWSPDGRRISFTAQRGDANFDVYDIDVATGQERRLTSAPEFDDGADYAPDGTMYFGSNRSGAFRIWKMDRDGGAQTQVTHDDAYQDWFPHPSPDGRWLVWLSYPAGVAGLERLQPVALRIAPRDGSAAPRVLTTLTGGHGTINAPPWSPDSKALAFVSHQAVSP
jgi:Tol biopolymer transport system component